MSKKQRKFRNEQAASLARRKHPLYGRLGPASACRKIDPKTGEVVDEMPARFRREYTRSPSKRG